jgi:hypothetical protein
MLTIYKFGKWLVEKIGIKTLIALPLLLVAIGSGAFGLSTVIRSLDSEFLMRMVVLAVILAWVLARSRISAWLAWILMLSLGLLVVVVYIGDLFLPLIALIRAGIFTGWQYLHYEMFAEIDLTALNLAYADVYYRLAGLFSTLGIWWASIISGSPASDRIAIWLIWSYAQWLGASWGGWFLRREKQVILGLLPSGVMLATVSAYTGSGTRMLLSFLFGSLMLMGVNHYNSSEDRWEKSKMDYPEEISKEAPLVTLGISVILLILAAVIPTISIRSIVRYVRDVSKGGVEDARPVIQSFGLEQSPYQESRQYLRGGLPRSHLIGSGPELSEQLVMTVQITGGGVQSTGDDVILPLYWRSRNYDIYTGDGWESSLVSSSSFIAGKPVFDPNLDYHTILQQDFRLVRAETSNIYAAGDLLTADANFEVFLRPIPEGAEISGSPLDLFGGSINTKNYRVQSVVPVVSEQELRSAPIGYPQWIRNRYLRLPENIPTRVLMLARGLTVNIETAYDRALVLEEYLRGFEYTLDIDQPPRNQDIVDYFLFESRKGYCDYYASTMVIMARAVQLPARLVTGYYRGEFDEANQRYVVTEADAHSWVEIYFSGIGWVPFEPTAIRSEIERLSKHQAIIGENEENLESLERQPLINMPPLGIVGIGVAGVILIVFLIFQIDILVLQRMPLPKAVEKLYRRLYSHGRSLNIHASRADTPYEFAFSLEDRISRLTEGYISRRLIYPAVFEIHDLTQIYAQTLYSDHPINIRERPKLFFLWRNLRRRMWLARFRQRTVKKSR